MPLGNTLTKALQRSSLITPGARPFHVTMHIHDAMNPALQADIEEFWTSPTLWKRIVTAPGLKQITTVNATGTHVENTGDYFPLWLHGFVSALFEPVPKVNQWNTPGAQLEQKIFPSGARSPRCLIGRVRPHADEPPAANASICFSRDGFLASIQVPEYDMGFSGFADYRGKQIARLYISQPGIADNYLVGKIMTLEDSYKKPDFFNTASGISAPNTLASLNISQPQIERMAEGPVHIVWPPVSEGNTEGTVTVFVSVDNTGRVREANVVRSDNSEIILAVGNQLRAMRWIPATSEGHPIQVEGLLQLPFSTKISSDVKTVAINTTPETPKITGGGILHQQKPLYPEQARVAHLVGPVYLRAIIAQDGSIDKLGVIDSPSPILSNAAMAAVRQWKYEPTLVDGKPAKVYTVITVNFGSPTTISVLR